MSAQESFAEWWINNNPNWGWPISDLWNWFYNIGMVIAGIIDNITNDIQNWTSDITNGLSNLAWRAWNWADTAWHYADNIYNSVIPNIVGDIQNWAMDTFQLINQVQSDAWSIVQPYVMGLIHNAESDLENWAMDVINHVSNDLQNWAQDAINLAIQGLGDLESIAKRVFDDAWGPIYRDIVQPIEQGISDVEQWITDIRNDVAKVWDWIYGEATDVVEAVIKAWDWIVWLGEHPLSELDALFNVGMPLPSYSWPSAEAVIETDLPRVNAVVAEVINDIFGAFA